MNINLKQFEIWFVTGSQHLYGPETLKAVAKHSQEIAATLNKASAIPTLPRMKYFQAASRASCVR